MKVIKEIKFGSHLYGTDTPNSDLDYKGIYLPSAREIVLNSYHKVVSLGRNKENCERNTKDDVDREYFSLDRYLDELMDGQTWALDFLFAPESSIVKVEPEGLFLLDKIYHNRGLLLTKNINAFVGYARKQAAKYGVKGTRMDALKRTMALLETLGNYDRLSEHWDKIEALVKESEALVSLERTPLIQIVDIPGPNEGDVLAHVEVCGRKMSKHTNVKTAKDCFGKILKEYGNRAKKAHLAGGVDWKALSHAVRVNNEALELLQTGSIVFPRPDRELLIKIKTSGETGAMEDKEVYEMIEEGMAVLHREAPNSFLRDEPDREWAREFVYQVYTDIVKKSNDCEPIKYGEEIYE